MPQEHDWPTYYRMLQQAVNLENAGAKESALAIYRDIVDNYWPIGAVYYRRPAILLEAAGDLEGALMFAHFAILNHRNVRRRKPLPSGTGRRRLPLLSRVSALEICFANQVLVQ